MERFFPRQSPFGDILQYSVPPLALAALAYVCRKSIPKLIVVLVFSGLLVCSIYEAFIPSWNNPKFSLLFLSIAYGSLSFWLILALCVAHISEEAYQRMAAR
jgi:hypothetical protein